jgi:hypothetical protein
MFALIWLWSTEIFGIFAVPKPKLGKTLDAGFAAMIRKFHQNDEHNRQLPGKK